MVFGQRWKKTTTKKEKITTALESEINSYNSTSKSIQRSHFPDLEHDLFSWVRRCESRKACLTDDTIIEKAKAMAETHGLANFKASAERIRRVR